MRGAAKPSTFAGMKNSATLLATVALLFAASDARAQDVTRSPTETDEAFARRALHLSDSAEMHVVSAAWNGTPTLFVDYVDNNEERPLFALQREPAGAYRKLTVTLGEQEGGTPDIEAIGFANADKDPAKELIVILGWNQQHADVSGTLYEVRIFDDLKPGRTSLTQLKISDHFGSECDCDWKDGTHKRFRYKTIAAVKAELERMGY